MATRIKPSPLTTLVAEKKSQHHVTMTRQSMQWLLKKIDNIKNMGNVANAINKEDWRKTRYFMKGGLYFFFYDAKGKRDLDYWDKFPLVLMLDKYEDGFLGLNLHYLPVKYRMLFLKKLMLYATLTPEHDIIRVKITYDILNMSRKLKEFRPCLKRYLYTHIRSKILTVKPDEWDAAMLLPVHKFVGAPAKQVWEESVQEIKHS